MNAVVERFNAFNRRLRPVKSGICSHCGKVFSKPSERNPLFHLTGDLPFGGSLICANCILDREFGDLSYISGEQTRGEFIDTINWVVIDTIN